MIKPKFRVFVEGRGMYPVEGFQFHVKGVTIHPVDSTGLLMDPWYHKDTDVVKFMQCTGLVDSDKQDVYVGDVLQHNFDGVLFNWLVCFNGYSFTVKNIGLVPIENTMEFKIDGPLMFIDRKVIGNMYNHPELMISEY